MDGVWRCGIPGKSYEECPGCLMKTLILQSSWLAGWMPPGCRPPLPGERDSVAPLRPTTGTRDIPFPSSYLVQTPPSTKKCMKCTTVNIYVQGYKRVYIGEAIRRYFPLKTLFLLRSRLAGWMAPGCRPPLPGERDPVAPLRPTNDTQDNRLSSLITLIRLYVSGDITIIKHTTKTHDVPYINLW